MNVVVLVGQQSDQSETVAVSRDRHFLSKIKKKNLSIQIIEEPPTTIFCHNHNKNSKETLVNFQLLCSYIEYFDIVGHLISNLILGRQPP